MKKLKMIVTSVVILAIVGSAFAFNTKKIGVFCTSGSVNPSDSNSTKCKLVIHGVKRILGTPNANYVPSWDGTACNGQTCTTSARFELD